MSPTVIRVVTLCTTLAVLSVATPLHAQPFYPQRVNLLIGAGYEHTRLDPDLPRDLINHENHPDDGLELRPGSPGETDLDGVTIDTFAVDVGVAFRPRYASFAFIVEYVIKFPMSSDGRAEHQQLNDPREPARGSFVYTQLADVAIGQALRAGVGGAWRLSERRDWWLEAQGVVDIGSWEMTFEKGWSRFSRDQPSLASNATGVEFSPKGRVTLMTGRWGLFGSLALTQVHFSHDNPQLESHTASGTSFSFGVRLILPERPIARAP